ncbi:MAG TPA: Asp-tRNA(Asn)/Glu-tRNA(Gln) amidotransferase subunit GatC [Syntrophorhabdaceae bacterium]|jgi:aspartyl-tRNA(Asn)/glutamyl-tRNA(Gln) amidotransferase subunit C|nr:Asp-tRNA(Asn)/Glu-tRNA(Gln) amidotransferase subunit GatC [Syntrophorhabdaceae bacterium]MDI9562317.1 Asp-tRNA(Asn)/Glu-tRNA(Gln) amidotransferase subunit GatC [Pseudomonadota bacterium]OQC47218.1 MAG: Aspartyl/glutamyl-tRNA(Asn/Gln) amidotransferase subunit C [Deltaproteobacteria bacterium ADurb.Bin026]MBP8697753.1 Asp-tRNA(Asn)/Glu-tRNA(Gln) amidotransferase subunit GatC [Syntrophorhabdaceae bacterium]HNZ58005.1 Asp-tRNA(Asn)/Glu-tRNA(Gln) amidotransferase subunit GatC [Syntrophorhabdaceae
MKITKDVVEYVAHLVRLELDPDEVGLYTLQIDSILEYMDKLNSVDTKGIEPTSHPMPIECALREDVEQDSFGVDESVQNAPERKGSFFKVPPVIETD